ncbi:hypothetical protein BC938DRAFT_475791 [Jimgerdemannia flammicorona]|uniref:Uncharacterized protein n=1 Tax=Jimgerdemannia flammicorona TaxID=994334 RepID=A0A433QR89_9FUNG|nr:hypothetical protein BC938DRAFT_475791 [Jimgerdemannia flammicorona]
MASNDLNKGYTRVLSSYPPSRSQGNDDAGLTPYPTPHRLRHSSNMRHQTTKSHAASENLLFLVSDSEPWEP